MRLNKNKILITGASAGIGKALLDKFLALDNQVIAVGRNEKKLQSLAQSDQRIIPFQCDLGQPEHLQKLVTFVREDHPDMNILINNAGIQYNYQFGEEDQESRIDHEIQVNLTAPILLINSLLPVLTNQENAAIVNVSSGLGLVPKKQAPVYCGTKAGLHIFSKSLRYQLETVKVFEMIPPLVDTEMTAGRGSGKISPEQLTEEFIQAFRRNRYEVNVGKVKLQKLINRLSPSLADRIMRGGGEKS
ncbi:MAG: SDR family NAD(P)-dependent oxidoreductase [Cytophagales bacterium]|nr:SDR family NAD(P)-dependent oxidoreductase [Cytophagales bacterium]